MRTSYLLLGAALGLVGTVRAQLFLELHGSLLQPIGGYGTSSAANGKVSSELLNFGRGMGGGIAIGCAINEVLGVEGRITYVSGTEQEILSSYGDIYTTGTERDVWKASYVRFEPMLRLSVGKSALRGYVAVGPSIAFGPKLAYTSDDTYKYTSDFNPQYSYVRTSSRSEDYTGGIGWGGIGALGVTWTGGSGFGLFAEVQAVAQSWAPLKGESTYSSLRQYGSGEVDNQYEQQSVDFESEYNANQADKSAKVHMPLSTWGVRAGVRFTFGGA